MALYRSEKTPAECLHRIIQWEPDYSKHSHYPERNPRQFRRQRAFFDSMFHKNARERPGKHRGFSTRTSFKSVFVTRIALTCRSRLAGLPTLFPRIMTFQRHSGKVCDEGLPDQHWF